MRGMEDSPRIKKNCPQTFGKSWGRIPQTPCLAKLYTAFSICIECPLFSRQNPPFLWYWFPLKIENLDTICCMYVNIFCSVRKSNFFSLFSILRIPLMFHFILLWIMKSSYKLLWGGGGGGWGEGHLNLEGGNLIFTSIFRWSCGYMVCLPSGLFCGYMICPLCYLYCGYIICPPCDLSCGYMICPPCDLFYGYMICPPSDLSCGYMICPPCDLFYGYMICPPSDLFCGYIICLPVLPILWVYHMSTVWPKLWVHDMPAVWPILRIYDMPPEWPKLWVHDMPAVWPIL